METIVNIPDDYLCPITHDLLKDPVLAADGQTYEKKAIIEWFSKGHKKSPLTGQTLAHTNLQENYRLKSIIESFKERLPMIQREQQVEIDLHEAIKLREKFIEDLLEKKDSKMLYLEKENKRLMKQIEDLRKQLDSSDRKIKELERENKTLKEKFVSNAKIIQQKPKNENDEDRKIHDDDMCKRDYSKEIVGDARIYEVCKDLQSLRKFNNVNIK